MELKDLIGKHILTGVDLYNKDIKEEYGSGFESCNCISFVLDDITYTAIEDPEDGYRSCMREIKVSKYKVKNIFPEVEVLVRDMGDEKYHTHNDALEFIDIKNGKVILTVGTENTDDYYPYFTSEFVPENMSLNNIIREE